MRRRRSMVGWRLQLIEAAILTLVCVSPLWAQSAAESCVATESSLRLDHVPIAVGDLDALEHRFNEEFGFSLKPGTAHTNGLRNLHIKFGDGSGLELMTVSNPSDAVAARYADLIADGGGGAYLAFSGPDIDEVLAVASDLEGEIEGQRSNGFDLAVFPRGHLLHPVFFVDVHERVTDRPEHVEHRNGAQGLEAVWVAVEDPARLTRLLLAFGARDCGMSRHPEHLFGRAIGVDGGTVYVVDAGLWHADPESAPVVSLTVSTTPGSVPDNFILGEAGGLWIELRPGVGSGRVGDLQGGR